jgi:uncharacterized small protein (DUF1192 family)
MATATMEERIAVLEAEVARLREKMEGPRSSVIGRTRSDFWRG